MTAYDVQRILEKLEAMTERLAILETKLDTHATHDERISTLERWRAFLTGMVALTFFEVQIVTAYIAIRGAM